MTSECPPAANPLTARVSALRRLLNFQRQGFVDAWGPLFFAAMLSGVAMDYTLFLMSAARQHSDLTGDPQFAMHEALRTSGRVVVAAADVLVAVLLTFALPGPLAPKDMAVILAVAVFLDALCIRLIVLPSCCAWPDAPPGTPRPGTP